MEESSLPRDSKKGKAIVLREEPRGKPDEQVSSLRALEEKLPKGYKPPTIGEYDVSKDLEDHLRKFRNAILLHQYSDAIKCRVFLNTLSGSAQKWFDGLPIGSIICFHDFKIVFLCHFTNSRKYQKIDHCLFVLKEGSAEPLRSYIKRFNQVAQDIPSTTFEILISVFSHGLVEGEFFRDLIQDPMKNFDEMLGKAASYINVEEAQVARQKADKAPTPANKLEKRPPQPPAQPLPHARDARLPFPPGQDPRPAQCVAAVQAPRPRPWGLCCYTYHRSHTHARSDCFQFARDSQRTAELGLPPPEIVPKIKQRILAGQHPMAGQSGRPLPIMQDKEISSPVVTRSLGKPGKRRTRETRPSVRLV
ncbi:uncharacterized protein LOC122050694 [Zingiber officinale]|uniref:uncharacterized protein LOC122050694 n=1 Tax=Zingiber officinale TaxID=94328 RepID=UPI001C4B8E50|nr:uncharacterized protein LOC122050694 [Zingiber officinale]